MRSKMINQLKKELVNLQNLIKEENDILTRLKDIQSHCRGGLKLTDMIEIWLSESCLTVLNSQIATKILVADDLLRRLDCKTGSKRDLEKLRERNNEKFEELVSRAERQFAEEIVVDEFCRKARRISFRIE